MRDPGFASAFDMLTDLAPPLPLDVRASAGQIEDDDPALAQALRAMAWDAYLQAGRPLGAGEDAMWAWWAFGQGTTTQ